MADHDYAVTIGDEGEFTVWCDFTTKHQPKYGNYDMPAFRIGATDNRTNKSRVRARTFTGETGPATANRYFADLASELGREVSWHQLYWPDLWEERRAHHLANVVKLAMEAGRREETAQ